MSAARFHGVEKTNRTLLLKFSVVAVIMFGFGYLLVPFYEQICNATGLRDIDGPDEIISVPTENPENILAFATTADGKPVMSRVEQKVFAKGVDQTALLRKLGIPLQPQLEATDKALDALPQAEWAELLRLGLADTEEYDAGQGMRKHLEARWALSVCGGSQSRQLNSASVKSS